MRDHINKGDKVSWQWGEVRTIGQVIDLYTQRPLGLDAGDDTVLKVNSGAKALLIELSDGRKILKLESEVTKES